MNEPGISVVVPAFERLPLLESLLRTLARERNGLAVPSEVIVADSSSESLIPSVKKLCDSFSAHYLRSRSRNPAVSRNNGFRAAKHPIVLFVDSDCEAEPGLLAAHINAYNYPKTGGVAGVTRFTGEDGPGYLLMQCTPYLLPFIFSETRKRVDWAPSSNISYRRNVLEMAGGFDESMPVKAGGEDVMLGWKVTGAGHEILCSAEAAVTHRKETWNSMAAALQRVVRWGRANCHIAMAIPARTRRNFHYAALLFLLSLPAAVFLMSAFGGRLWLFLPVGCLAGLVTRKALSGTPSRQSPAPFHLRAGGALLMLAFEISYVLECLYHLHPAIFTAPVHDDELEGLTSKIPEKACPD
ncbi:MAG: glycosyltransferase family 2 protein [bacterium]